MPVLVSSNWAAWILGVIAFLLTELLLYMNTRKEERRKRLTSNLLIGLAVTLFVYGTLFVWSTIQTVYDDHHDVVGRWRAVVNENKRLEEEKQGLVNPNYRDSEISTLKQEIEKLKKQGSPSIGIYPVAHDQRPNAPKMEYVFTTGKIRTPVEITATCDFAIADMNTAFLTTGGDFVEMSSKQSISTNKFRVSITSPAWTPASPLFVTVFFAGQVNRMPSCSFDVI